jgi:tight adherence protein C
MALLISIAVFVVVMVTIVVLYRVYGRPVSIHARLGEAIALEQPQPGTGGQPERTWLVRVVQTIGEQVPISPADAGLARRYLIAAGFRSDRAVRVYYGSKILLAAIFFLAAVILRGRIGNPILSVLVLPAGAAGGFFLPNFIIDRMVGKRQERIRLSLPDALDLMVVCMEAGLALDQAIASVSRELRNTYRDISDELGLVTLEMRAGKRRMEALKNLAERTGEPELKKLVATMIQSDRFGTGVAEALRTHSEYLRVRRRQAAEERAAKVGVKLVFPIFLFILPAMLVVAAGPGLLAMAKHLLPLMRGFGQ